MNATQKSQSRIMSASISQKQMFLEKKDEK